MKFLLPLAGLACMLSAHVAHAEVQDCIEITAVPVSLTQQAVYCLKQNIETAITSGSAITIAANNVTIDLNGFKLGGASGGENTLAFGISAVDRLNVTIRNGTVRGFFYNINLGSNGDNALSSGHLVEDMRIEKGRFAGIAIVGTRSTIRDNRVFDTGSGASTTAYGILASGGGGFEITDNTVNGVSETAEANGIYAGSTFAPYIHGNRVREVAATLTRGIYTQSSPRAVIQNNFIATSATGTQGINAPSTPDVCMGNLVTNFTTPLTGCLVDEGNTVF